MQTAVPRRQKPHHHDDVPDRGCRDRHRRCRRQRLPSADGDEIGRVPAHVHMHMGRSVQLGAGRRQTTHRPAGGPRGGPLPGHVHARERDRAVPAVRVPKRRPVPVFPRHRARLRCAAAILGRAHRRRRRRVLGVLHHIPAAVLCIRRAWHGRLHADEKRRDGDIGHTVHPHRRTRVLRHALRTQRHPQQDLVRHDQPLGHGGARHDERPQLPAAQGPEGRGRELVIRWRDGGGCGRVTFCDRWGQWCRGPFH